MLDFNGAEALTDLFSRVASGSIEIYNEISLQLELGHFLRTTLSGDFAVEFERPAHYFGARRGLTKKEIDIVVASRGEPKRRWAIELKVPRNGQYPEQMFSACEDLKFLEELCDAGFDAGWFAMLVDAPPFYNPALPASNSIYAHFRQRVPIHGLIQKPTRPRDRFVDIRGCYRVCWTECGAGRYVAVIEVRAERAD